MKSSKNALHFVVSVLVLTVLGYAGYSAVHSNLFALQRIDIQPFSDGYPLRVDEVEALLQLPKGNTNLFELDLKPIETRLLKQPWIKGVILGKQFPGQISVQVIERKPVALVNSGSPDSQGKIFYLEEDGTLFDERSVTYARELPILSGFSAQNKELLQRLSSFVSTWFDPSKLPGLKLSALSFDAKLGLRAIIVYPMKNKQWMRSVLELGLNVEEAALVPQERLKRVLDYLADKSMTASKIWLGDGKKIVVKIAGRS
ncbi:MAG: FtsQ-type POTRA domain-containing protein [Bdellovibrionales bacterium]|nr:FtsQ-type POTRA domain-containing protein [Bdellovibrionales bacterium]